MVQHLTITSGLDGYSLWFSEGDELVERILTDQAFPTLQRVGAAYRAAVEAADWLAERFGVVAA